MNPVLEFQTIAAAPAGQPWPQNNFGEILPAGVNIGFGWTKLATPSGCQLWPSVVSKHEASITGSRKPDPLSLVLVSGQTYEVGEGAVTHGQPMKALHRDFASTDIYAAMVQATINRLAEQSGQWSIVVGLAINHFQDANVRAAVRKLWMGEKGDGMHHTSTNRNLRIANIQILPETMGGAMVLLADPKRRQAWSQGQAVVLDFGRYTTAWVQLRDGTPTAQSGAVEFGMTNYIKDLTDRLRTATGRPSLTEEEAELAALGKRVIYGKPIDGERHEVDVASLAKASAQAVWPQFEARFKAALGDLRGMDLAVIGGGATVYYDSIKAAYPDSYVFTPEGSQMLIACGLLEAATQGLKALRG